MSLVYQAPHSSQYHFSKIYEHIGSGASELLLWLESPVERIISSFAQQCGKMEDLVSVYSLESQCGLKSIGE